MTTQDPIETQAVVVRDEAPRQLERLPLDEVHAQLEFIRQVMAKEMREGQDYGKIPGCGDKPGLFQPGAQKLLLTFQLTPHVKKEVLRELPHPTIFGHREYEFTLTLKSKAGREWDGVGTCSTLESKYRYRKSFRKCPTCGKETIFKDKNPPHGFYCWSKKGGCGAKFGPSDPGIISQEEGKADNDNPAEFWNTVRKMAFKRALVHGSINATNTSELWSQDLEDLPQAGRYNEYIPGGDEQKLNVSTCPVIGVFSNDDYSYLCSLPKSDPETLEANECQILFERLLQRFPEESLSTTKSIAESFSLHWNKGGDIRIKGEHRLVGEGLLGVPGFVAVVLLRSSDSKGPSTVQGGSDDRKIQSGWNKSDGQQATGGTVGHSGGRGSRKDPLSEPTAVTRATTKTRSWAIGKIGADVVGPRRNCLEAYLRALGWIKEGETVEAWHLENVPTNGAELQKLLIRLGEFEADQRAKEP